MDSPRPLLGLPEVLKADRIAVVEGETSADAGRSLDLVTTTSAGGSNAASKTDWSSIAGKEALIFPDNDEAGEKYAKWVTKKLLSLSPPCTVRIVRLQELPPGGDLVDWVAARRDKMPKKEMIAELNRLIGETEVLDPDTRFIIPVTTDEYIVNNAASESLGEDETIFKRGGRLVYVTEDSRGSQSINDLDGQARIVQLSVPVLRERLTKQCRFVRESESEEEVKPAHPPDWCVKAVLNRGEWPGVRKLIGIATSPIIRADGTVLSAPGYDVRTGLYLSTNCDGISVKANPGIDDARRAVQELLEVVADFPFEQPAHRSAWLAYVSTPLARHAFRGPAPLTVVDANVRGSGKTLLVDLASNINQGRDIAKMANPRDDEECRKQITTIALACDPQVLIDNVDGGLGCASLDAALTSTIWKDRKLGGNESVELPLLTTWAATGNNVVLRADTSRRVLHIRLRSPLEQPETRTGFRHPDIRRYVLEHRPRLLSAVLTILRAYFAAGRPDQSLPAWGSFEGWSGVVRGALVWAGQPDPADTRQELVEAGDRELLALRGIIETWDSVDPYGRGLSAADLLEVLKGTDEAKSDFRAALMELCPPRGSTALPSARQIGNKLGHLRGRVACGKAIDYGEGRGRIRLWVVQSLSVSESPESPSGDSCATETCRVTAESPPESPLFRLEKSEGFEVGDSGDSELPPEQLRVRNTCNTRTGAMQSGGNESHQSHQSHHNGYPRQLDDNYEPIDE